MAAHEKDFDPWAEKQLLGWIDGATFVQPWPGALGGLQEKGLVGPGDILSAKITERGRAVLDGREPFPG